MQRREEKRKGEERREEKGPLIKILFYDAIYIYSETID